MAGTEGLISLNLDAPVWERFFTVSPLVLVGTREASGADDLAPKHMVMPVGWSNYFAFVCTPKHNTWHNVKREGVFSVTYPRPSQVVQTSLAATPRCGDEDKTALLALPSFPGEKTGCPLVEGGYVFLECELDQIIDGFGEDSLIIGQIISARVDRRALRMSDRDDHDLIHNAPLLAYVPPARFAVIDETQSFPFSSGEDSSGG